MRWSRKTSSVYTDFRESVPGKTDSTCKGPALGNEPGVFVDKKTCVAGAVMQMSASVQEVVNVVQGVRVEKGLWSGLHLAMPLSIQHADGGSLFDVETVPGKILQIKTKAWRSSRWGKQRSQRFPTL